MLQNERRLSARKLAGHAVGTYGYLRAKSLAAARLRYETLRCGLQPTNVHPLCSRCVSVDFFDRLGYTILLTPQMWMRDRKFEVYAQIPYSPEQELAEPVFTDLADGWEDEDITE